MSERPNYPELENIELPQPPMAWEPSKRQKQLMSYPDGAFWRILNDHQDELTERYELSEYMEWLKQQYIMPGHVVSVVRAVLTETHPGENYWSIFEDESAVMQRVEHDLMELEPSESTDGLQWFESSAGFAAGRYPTADVAKLMNMEPEVFRQYVRDTMHPSGWVIIKTGNYLIPVTINEYVDDDKVIISGAQELTPDGNKLIDSVLYAYEKGLESRF